MPVRIEAPPSPAPPRKADQKTHQWRRLSKPLPNRSSTTPILHTAPKLSPPSTSALLGASVVDELEELDGVELQELDGVELQELDGVELQELDGIELHELDGVELQELDGVELRRLSGVKLVLSRSARRRARSKHLSVRP